MFLLVFVSTELSEKWKDLLVGMVFVAEGGGGKCERISVLSVWRGLDRAEMKMSGSKGRFLWRVV